MTPLPPIPAIARNLALVLLLAACGSPGGDGMMMPAREGVTFVPDDRGLGVAGRVERIDFGRAPDGVVPVMTREMGDFRALPLTGCPTGVVRHLTWGDLTLTFTAERFVGWRKGTERAGRTCVYS